ARPPLPTTRTGRRISAGVEKVSREVNRSSAHPSSKLVVALDDDNVIEPEEGGRVEEREPDLRGAARRHQPVEAIHRIEKIRTIGTGVETYAIPGDAEAVRLASVPQVKSQSVGLSRGRRDVLKNAPDCSNWTGEKAKVAGVDVISAGNAGEARIPK